jgi:hypothetical protein
MIKRHFAPVTVALLSGGLLLAPLRADGPFTHLAYIPAGVDPGTIRFEKARVVKISTSSRSTTDSNYCREVAFRDPGGSVVCPQAQTGAAVPAYEVTFSLQGQPLASDERADRNFTFRVYFRPEELGADVQKALAGKKLNRSDAAGYFTVSTYRENARRVAVDNKQSRFCGGNYVDGQWSKTEAGCQDDVRYASVIAPSDYITVRVEASSPRVERARIASGK